MRHRFAAALAIVACSAAAFAQTPAAPAGAPAAESPVEKPLVVAAAPSATPLLLAAKNGDTAGAIALIDRNADVNAAASDGTTALHYAVYRDDVALVDRLLKAKAKVTVANSYGSSPLSEAAIVGNPEVISKLLKAGADPNFANGDDQTPLMVLARTNNVAAAEALLRHGADVNVAEKWKGQTALMWAAAQDQADMVKLLVKHRANVNARSTVNRWNRLVTAEPRAQVRPIGGLTPLLYATRQGCFQCVKTLVEAKADVDLPDPEGVTPLIMAITNFHFDIAAYLLEKKANPNKWDWWGRTPLYSAVDLNTIPHGGRPDRPSLDATTSLKLIEALLGLGANPNAQLKLFPPYRAVGPDRGADMMLTIGATPLLRAAKAGDVPAVKLLLAHGADPNLPNMHGVTPVMAAAGLASNEIDTRGRFKTEPDAVETIELLVKAGADVNARETRGGQTALHGAALWGYNDVVKTLVANKADIDAKDAKGRTPLDSAMGRAGGHGRGGTRIEVHESTAALIEQLAKND
jgi:ankyrin repeat protein